MRLIILLVITVILSCSSNAEGQIDSSVADGGETIVYLSRHAEKGPGDNPQLTEAGRKRAQRLASMLKDQDISAVYATNFRRTQATARPLAKSKGRKIRHYSATRGARSLVSKWLQQHRGETIFVVGHSNTVPRLVNALIEENRYGDIDEDTYDRLFKVVIPSEGRASVTELSSN